MNLVTLMSDVKSALEAAEWVTTAGYSVLSDSGSAAFSQEFEAALMDKGFVLVVLAPIGMPEAASMSGKRAAGKVTIPVAVVAASDSDYTAICGRIVNVVKTIMALAGGDLLQFDFGRVAEEESALTYYVSFDVRTVITG